MTTTAPAARAARRLDPWAILAGAAALLPLWKSLGAPLGEPVADDFDFLHHALFGPASLLDGGGALIYWRPLARQIYYGALGHVMLSNPLAIGLLHVALLAAAAVLIQRALAPALGGARAAAAATFPVIADSARTLILWPAAIQDLGALFFCALALHETTRRRLPNALLAMLAALLCKELAIVAALLLPFVPGTPPRERRRWAIGVGALLVAWGIAYMLVLRSAHLMVQSQLEAARPPLLLRAVWAFRSALQDGFGLASVPWPVAIGVFALVAIVTIASTRSPNPRRAWILWGAIWFALATLTLAETYPVWGSFRSTLGMAGLGIACAAALASRPWALGGLVALRLIMLLLAPRAPEAITAAPPGDGSGFDFATLARLQRVSHQTRQAVPTRPPVQVHAGLPWPPPGSRFVWLQRPLMSERAFAHSKALQVWLRDTTVAWGSLQDVTDDSTLAIGGGLEYNAAGRPQISELPGENIRRLASAIRMMRAEQYRGALAELFDLDRWGGAVLRSIVAGKRALCYLALEDDVNSRKEAERSLRLWDSGDGHYVLAVLLMGQGKPREAIAQLDTLLSLYPEDPSARMLRDTLMVETKR